MELQGPVGLARTQGFRILLQADHLGTGLVFSAAIADHGRMDARNAIQTPSQKNAPSPEFVVTRRMTGRTRDEHNGFVGRCQRQRSHGGEEADQKAVHWI